MELWIIYAILAALMAALVGIFSKIGITGVDATIATTIRGLSIALFMGGTAILMGKMSSIASIPGKSWVFIILTGVAGGLSWLWGFMALKAGGDVTAVNAIDRMSLILLVIFAALFLGEHFTWGKTIGALFIVVGTLLMTLKTEQVTQLLKLLHM
jgi:transporter family protein